MGLLSKNFRWVRMDYVLWERTEDHEDTGYISYVSECNE
jgi:hypothetical protein